MVPFFFKDFFVLKFCRGCFTKGACFLSLQVGAVGIQLVSILWFWRIARMVLYKLKKRNLKPKSS